MNWLCRFEYNNQCGRKQTDTKIGKKLSKRDCERGQSGIDGKVPNEEVFG